ncbi:dimethyl sulfoxide reductase anchor subunit family protein [Dyella sp.]|uniref:dimethyl sulfoxide reductase anchor subunit family protein n=1 Tax=Dyella sp. TaxID=1869338 RepID=UPI002D77B9AB|nr:DmsC/YnfH family molybdoenzyme membrane anchor subunit [Dyella sp.]HET6430885.1 DmsC/YnfH family molybdoenzyme membrane anchor subunit [Dyella sp.]
MHPALSVIFFTTLSGAGFGLWFWVGLRIALGPTPQGFEALGWWLLLVAGGIAAAIGLAASFLHLGKPQRAWRAFSQWRTSWLSREGVASVASFLPALALLKLLPQVTPATRIVAALLCVLCLATIACTAMIYASLKPIPAWRHRLVVPGYLLFALLTGGLPLLMAGGLAQRGFAALLLPLLAVAAIALVLLKLAYWRDIDRTPLPQTRGDAIGLPQRQARVFERPHTEANYLMREMGFVLARRHARPLRATALGLFGLLPLLCLALAWGSGDLAWIALPVAVVSALAGAFVERWLFFAQARHLVTLYY